MSARANRAGLRSPEGVPPREVVSRLVAFEHAGEQLLTELPDLLSRADDVPPADILDGVARRWVFTLRGACPCGAQRVLPTAAERALAGQAGPVVHLDSIHADDCPAGDHLLVPRVKAWLAGGTA